MNSSIEKLESENEELRLSLVAKQLDVDNINKQLKEGSATPLLF